jgi:hypothetical protein
MRDCANYLNAIKLICPVQPSLQKYTSSLRPQISPTTSPVPARQEGRIAIVTDVGRNAVDAAAPAALKGSQGGLRPVSEPAARQTSGTEAYGKTVWSWRPWLASSRRRRS